MSMDDFIFYLGLMLLVLVMIMAFSVARRSAARRAAAQNQQSSKARATATERQQIVEDIKATQTGQISDQISIIEELGSTSKNYRQYCEVIGNAMNSGGVIAPYSRREVAYYDLRCYRVDSNGETLIAHETSIEPFYFTDASCDTPVYVDIDSFGNNCVLVKATDRMEGPNSDFSKALNNAVKSKGGSYDHGWATAGFAQNPYGRRPGNVPYSSFGQGMPTGFDMFFGNYMPNQMGGFGGPAYHRKDSSNGTEALIGIGLGMLLSSLASSGTSSGQSVSQQQYTTSDPNGSFRGYHIVEDVVPLGSPIYCLGEMYKSGMEYHMAKSLSTRYPSSYFATKPEAEVVAHLA